MPQRALTLNRLTVGGGQIAGEDAICLRLPAGLRGYADAQVDDLHGVARRDLPWRAPLSLSLTARFGPAGQTAVGTAGFGFWNAPYGDLTHRRPALPAAAWFFYASEPNSLPFLHHGVGWYAATIDMRRPAVVAGGLLALPLLLANRLRPLRQHVWPRVLRLFGVACTPLQLAAERDYRFHLAWEHKTCRFWLDDRCVLTAPAPRGRLGFVAWIDNQYLIATPTGRLASGVLPVPAAQWLELRDLRVL